MIKLPENVISAITLLEKSGAEAYAVGGAVRDSLLGKTATDFDITTSAKPEKIKAVFKNFKVIETGIKHGTVTVIIENEPIEITTYRIDGKYADNRHPEKVVFASKIEDDLSRRDFTVNAIAYNPKTGIIDPFCGMDDLKKRIIRTVGESEKRFHEDALRILRCVRFASVLGFEIEKNTADSVIKCVDLLDNISAERIFSELKKLLSGKNAGRIMESFPQVITKVVPELSESVGFSQKSKYHIYDVYTHTAKAISASENKILVRLSLLFHDCGKPYVCTEDGDGRRHFAGHQKVSAGLAKQGLLRLKCDSKTINTVANLVLFHDYPIIPEKSSVKKLLSKVSYEDARLIAMIRFADMASHAKEYVLPIDFTEKVLNIIDEFEKTSECVNLKTLAVDGDDLVKMGIKEGKKIGDILKKLLDEVLSDNVPNEKEVLLKMAKEMV